MVDVAVENVADVAKANNTEMAGEVTTGKPENAEVTGKVENGDAPEETKSEDKTKDVTNGRKYHDKNVNNSAYDPSILPETEDHAEIRRQV